MMVGGVRQKTPKRSASANSRNASPSWRAEEEQEDRGVERAVTLVALVERAEEEQEDRGVESGGRAGGQRR